MDKQDAPERRFIVEKKPVMRELPPEEEHPNLVAGAQMSTVALFGDVLRWIDRRRAAKARKRQKRTDTP